MNDAHRQPGPGRKPSDDARKTDGAPSREGFDPEGPSADTDHTGSTDSASDTGSASKTGQGDGAGTGTAPIGSAPTGRPAEDDLAGLLRDALRLEAATLNPAALHEALLHEAPLLSVAELDAAVVARQAPEALWEDDDESHGAAWCQALLADSTGRADLIDFGTARLDTARFNAGADLETATATDGEALGATIRQAAHAAFARSLTLSEQTAHVVSNPAGDLPAAPAPLSLDAARGAQHERSQAGNRSGLAAVSRFAVAAAVLVGLGVAIVALGGLLHDGLTGNGTEATAGMRLQYVTEFSHATRDGLIAQGQSGAPRPPSHTGFVPVGESFSPAHDQVVVFGLGDASHVMVGEGGRLHVAAGQAVDARLMAAARIDLLRAERRLDLAALLRLQAGEARLSSGGQDPVLLAVGDELLLVLWNGKCHVALDPGAEAKTAGPAIALAKDTRLLVYRAANGDQAARAFDLKGPRRILLSAEGPVAFGTPAASLFRDLELFGGGLRHASPQGRHVRVEATLWRMRTRASERRNGRFLLAQSGASEFGFRPQRMLAGATALQLWIRAPEGTVVRALGPVPASTDAVPAGTPADPAADTANARARLGEVVLRRDTRKLEPGMALVRLDLDADWMARLGGQELVLWIRPPAKGGDSTATRATPITFEGVAFVLGGSRPGGSKMAPVGEGGN